MNIDNSHRKVLSDLIAANGESYLSISILLGRNHAYVQQFIKRGSPRKLDEDDRHFLAVHFNVDEKLLRPSRMKKSIL
jgi:hypothetical protein